MLSKNYLPTEKILNWTQIIMSIITRKIILANPCINHIVLNHSKTFTSYNHVHNILKLFNDRANFPFTTSERKRDYQ